MDSLFRRSRFFVWVLPTLFCMLSASIVFGQTFGPPFFGMQPFSGNRGCPPPSCGDVKDPSFGGNFYVGWMEDRQETSVYLDGTGGALLGARNAEHRYPERGLWLGVSGSFGLNERVSVLGSGWYLFPSDNNGSETYNEGGARRAWKNQKQWWFVDGFLAYSPQSTFSFLGGGRFDYYTTKFKDASDPAGVASSPEDTADVISQGWIPLVGGQYAYTGPGNNLVIRAVGFPLLLGNVKYNETFSGATHLEGRGNWSRGYFFELFSQYAFSAGPGFVGVFGRWNTTQGKAQAEIDAEPAAGSQDWEVVLTRSSWTLGGTVGVSF